MSHAGCSGTFSDGKLVVDKIRMMGYAPKEMPAPLNIECKECGEDFEMAHFEEKCPKCGMVYGVTPCHAYDAQFVMAAGIDY
jgi:hypothetical protein